MRSPADLATLKWGYKKARELARRLPVYRGEYLPGNPVFPAGSQALCRDEVKGPVDISAEDIRYTSADDEAIEQYNRSFGKVFPPSPSSLVENPTN